MRKIQLESLSDVTKLNLWLKKVQTWLKILAIKWTNSIINNRWKEHDVHAKIYPYFWIKWSISLKRNQKMSSLLDYMTSKVKQTISYIKLCNKHTMIIMRDTTNSVLITLQYSWRSCGQATLARIMMANLW